MRAWFKVAACEAYRLRDGAINWHFVGPLYSGALGITDTNWDKYGGRTYARNAGDATPAEQVTVARRIEGTVFVPDQHGCGSW